MSYRFQLRKLFPDNVLADLLDCEPSDTEVAAALSAEFGVPVSRQNVTYWRAQHEAASPNAKVNKLNKAGADREIIKERQLRKPTPADDMAVEPINTGTTYARILVIPDLHCPYNHPDALAFLRSIRDQYLPDVVVNLGDETDGHAISFHNSDPNLDSAGVELERARAVLAELHADFPEMLLCHSNHGSLLYRRSKAAGIPVEYLRTYREVLFPNGGGEQWEWAYSHQLNTKLGPVLFKHQTTGDVKTAAAHEGCSVVAGHQHGKYEVVYGASTQRLYFGATCGCLIDHKSLAFEYGREFPNKPILGCMVIWDGIPIQIPMVLDDSGRWVGRQ